MAEPWPGESGIRIKFLPPDATTEYLRGMMSMVSNVFNTLVVTFDDPEGATGWVTFFSTSEAERLIEGLDGIPNGAMNGKVLKVEQIARRNPSTPKRSNDACIPDAKKRRTRTGLTPLNTKDTSPSPATALLSERVASGGESEEGYDGELEMPDALVDLLEKFPPPIHSKHTIPHAKFELMLFLSDLQRVVRALRSPDLRGQAYQSPEARKDFLTNKILGPDGGNLLRLSKGGAQVVLMGHSSVGTPDPALHILISSDSHFPLCSAALQVENLLDSLMDVVLGQTLLSHGSEDLRRYQA